MTPQESRIIGGKQGIKGAAISFLIFEIVMLVRETRGDIANGILFFIQAQLNVIVFLIIVLYFAFMYLLGRQAGVNILIKGKSHYIIGLIWGLVTTLSIIALKSLILTLFRSHDMNYTTKEILGIATQNFLVLVIPMVIVWIIVANLIKNRITQ